MEGSHSLNHCQTFVAMATKHGSSDLHNSVVLMKLLELIELSAKISADIS